MRIPTSILFVGFIVTLISGCGSDARVGIKGTISFQGKPLDTGVISFVPVDPNSPTPGSAVITNGTYEIPKEQGLAPGQYKISVSSPDGKTPSADPNALPGPSGNFSSKDRISKKFNLESPIEITIDPKPNPKIYDLNVD